MGLVLDAGGLIGFERGDRSVAALVEAVRRRRERTVTSSGCVAQVWRGGGSRQALLIRLLRGVDEQGLDRQLSRIVGALCERTATTDVIDAHMSLLARDGDTVLTSDVEDVLTLLRARDCRAQVEHC